MKNLGTYADLIFSSSERWDEREKRQMTRAEISQRTLADCGVPDGGYLGHLPKILTGEVDFNCAFNVKRNSDYLNVYLNPGRKSVSIKDVDFSGLTSRFESLVSKPDGGSAPEPTPEPKQPELEPGAEEDDGIPF